MHLLKDRDLISCGRSCISSSLRKHWMFMSSELLCENQSGRVSWNQKMAEYVDSNGLGQTVYLALFLSWSLRCSYLSVLSSMKVFLLWHLKLWFGLYFINFTWFGNGGMTPIQLIMRLTMIIHMNNHYFCIHNSGMIQMIILTFFFGLLPSGVATPNHPLSSNPLDSSHSYQPPSCHTSHLKRSSNLLAHNFSPL